ncbi:uncharacterized protein LOC128552681 [Mercenaria mercenaria]|uniref:uncharacterized protein LOC128552681 n=1 Tax=Mercenaria mercenaria TaxID=6596 RepID=UPI00234EEAF2|nr:uncharacterized protein LOC128552681 [Mercenaria mercenaria]
MDRVYTVFLLVCLTSVAFTYNCVEKSCIRGFCFYEKKCTTDDSNGCYIDRYGGIYNQSLHNCSSAPCLPFWSNTTDYGVYTRDCCFSDGCNNDWMESSTVDDPDVDECYSIECDYEGCIREAIQEGKAKLCTLLPDEQCRTFIRANPLLYFTSCYEFCNASIFTFSQIDCCSGDLCNSPPGPTTESTTPESTTANATMADVTTAEVTTADGMVKCGNETSDPAATKNCISGAGSLAHPHYLICYLSPFSFLFLHSLFSKL